MKKLTLVFILILLQVSPAFGQKTEDPLKFTEYFGIGPGVTTDVGGKRKVGEVVEERVKIENEEKAQIALMAEVHYFLGEKLFPSFFSKSVIDIGPFIALQPNTEIQELVSGFGSDGMLGIRVKDNISFNIGVGQFLHKKVRTLKDGFFDG